MFVFWFVLGCLLPAFFLSLLVTKVMIRLAPYCGLVDMPAARKVHAQPTPLGGGVGIVCGVIFPLALAHLAVWAVGHQHVPADWIPVELKQHLAGVLHRAPQMWGILVAGLLLSVTGLIDDVTPLSWKFRLVIQFCVALSIVAAGVRATLFVGSPVFGILVTVFWLVLMINSLNFLDNMDGLTSGISLIVSLFFALIMLTQTSEPRWLVAGMLLVISGACAGFLVWNWTPAKIFMGDSGSTFLGLMLGCLTILGTFYDASSLGTHVMLAPLFILAVPLYDFTSVMIIRLKRGLSPFHADKNHFSHRLVDLGMSRKNAVLTIYLCTIITGLAALLLYQVPDWSSACTIVLLVACVLGVIAILETTGRRASRYRSQPALAVKATESGASQAVPSEAVSGEGGCSLIPSVENATANPPVHTQPQESRRED